MLEGIARVAHSRHGFCIVVLCQGKDDFDENFFAFVAIEPHNFTYFKKTYRRGEANDFSAFGHELLRGPGLLPSDDLIDYVSNKHNVEFFVDRRFMERLVALATQNNPVSATQSPFPLKPAEALSSS